MQQTRSYFSYFILTAFIILPYGVASGENPKVPFLDMNDVRQIQINSNILSFTNPNGILLFDTQNQTWALESKQVANSGVQKSKQSGIAKTLFLPDWVPDSYRKIRNHFVISGNHFWLSATVSEGSTYISDVIIDNKNRVIYSIPYQNTQSFAVQGDNIWLGHPRGLVRINRVSRQRIDYEIDPAYEKITGWVKYKNNFYISTYDGKLFFFNPESGIINSLPLSYDSFDSLFISLESKKNSKVALFSFTNPVLRSSLLSVGVIPIDPRNGVALGHSGIITFDLNDLENPTIKNLGLDSSGMMKTPSIYFGVKKLVTIRNDIFVLGNHREYFEGGEVSEMGGVSVINEIGKRFDIPECGEKPVVAIKSREKNRISILQQTLDPKTDEFTYYECNIILNEPNENRVVSKELAKTTYSVRVLERIKLLKNNPKIKGYAFLKFELTPRETHELVKDWNVIPALRAYYNRPLNIKDYHSPMYQDVDGILYPENEQRILDLN